MDILKKFIKTEIEFFGWFHSRYGLPKNVFEESSYIDQCESIWRFLGYPVEAPPDWTKKDITQHTENVLYIYESLLDKYPDGPPDMLKEIKSMSFAEILVKYPELHKPANILHSIHEAIIDYDRFEIKTNIRLSLHDALTALKVPIITIQDEPEEINTFWETAINSRINESAPF